MKTVVITRPEMQAKKFQSLLLGIDTIILPTIKIISRVLDDNQQAEILDHIINGSWSIFTSANAVQPVSKLYIVNAPIAAVGEETATELRNNHLYVSFIPEDKSGIGLVTELYQKNESEIISKPVLVFQGTTASGDICNYLNSKGVITKKFIVYDVQNSGAEDFALLDVLKFINALTENEIILTFFSSKTARSFNMLVPQLLSLAKNNEKLLGLIKKSPVIVIGEKTKEAAVELGFENIYQADDKRSESVAKLIKSMVFPC